MAAGPIRLLDLGRVSCLRSQAIYSAVASAMDADTPDTVIITTPATRGFCIGYHQHGREVLDTAHCAEAGIPIIRRELGGGAVYLDEGQLFYQCVFHRSRAPRRVDALYDRYLAAPVSALRGLGLAASLHPPNEIEVYGKRIAGTGAASIGDACVVVGNILFDFPSRTMSDAWIVPSDAFRQLAHEGLERYLTTLRCELETPPSRSEMAELLVEAFEGELGRKLVPGGLSAAERQALERTEARLGSVEWLYQERPSPRTGLKITGRVNVAENVLPAEYASLRTTVRLADGIIDAVRVEPRADGLEGKLVGCHPAGPATREAIERSRCPEALREPLVSALAGLSLGGSPESDGAAPASSNGAAP